MPRAIIHVGTMKTGSSSIQRCLADNPGPLAAAGSTYLGWPARHSERIAAALTRVSADAPNIVVSDEGLWHFMNTSRSDTKKIARLLADYDIEIVVYLRRPDDFLNSWYLQGLKTGTGARTFSQFLDSPFVQAGLDFRAKLSALRERFGVDTLTLRAYERSQLVAGDAVRDFLTVAGFDHEKFTMPERVNQQPESTDETLIRSALSGLNDATDIEATAARQLLDNLRSRGYAGRTYPLFTKSEVAILAERFSPVFEEIHAEYGVGASPTVFDEWIDADAYEEQEGSLREFQETLAGYRPSAASQADAQEANAAPTAPG